MAFPENNTAVDNGGILFEIDAYQDGVGTIIGGENN
jgi:hypothetical protein